MYTTKRQLVLHLQSKALNKYYFYYSVIPHTGVAQCQQAQKLFCSCLVMSVFSLTKKKPLSPEDPFGKLYQLSSVIGSSNSVTPSLVTFFKYYS